MTPIPQVNAQNACVLPSPQALDCYYGATTPDPPESFPPSWCTTIHNNHWFAFTADATTATFNLSVFGCASGNGIQAAVLSTADCVNFQFVSPCLGNIPTQTSQTLTATNLTIGEVYYLCIDGSGGALCDYAINGSVPTVTGTITGLCLPGPAIGTYNTAATSVWTINPPTAGTITTSATGTSITVNWLEPGPAQVCARNAFCPDAPEDCLDIVVGEDIQTEEHVNLCQGETVECAGKTYTTAGTFNVTLPTYLNCDSLIKCVVHLIPVSTHTEVVYMCQNQSVTCAEQDFFAPGTYQVNLDGAAYTGCDSIVTCKVNLIPTTISPFYLVTMCGPAEYQLCTTIYTETGLFTEICTSSQGCDSIVNVNLAILEPEAIIAPPGILDCTVNQTITLNGTGSSVNNAVGGVTLYKWSGPGIISPIVSPSVVVNQPGEYCLVVTHGRAGIYCSDTTCVTVQAVSAVPPLPQITGNGNPCGDSTLVYTAIAGGSPQPDSYIWSVPGGVSYTNLSPNVIQITWDTVVTGNICVKAVNGCGESQSACLPVSVQAPLQQPQLTGPGAVCANGGAYLYHTNVEQAGVNYNWTVPAGATFTGGGDSIWVNFLNAASGQVCVTAQNACGMLAPVCQAVQVSPIPTATISGDVEICNGTAVDLTFTLSGNGPFDVVWSNGAQNFTLNDISSGHSVSVSPAANTTYSLVSINDNTQPNACSGPVNDQAVVTVWQHFSAAPVVEICEGNSVFLAGANQTSSGVYTDQFQTIHGCDSIITTTLIVYDIDTTVLNSTTCVPADSGTTITILPQFGNGCDSVVISTVVLLPSDSTFLFDTNCDPANVGVFVQNLTNKYGCDSTVVTTITFSLSDTTYVQTGNCDPAAVGTFQQLLTTTDGCDSLIITTVSLLPSDTVYLSGQDCNPANVGVFTQVFTNQYGCDSTIIRTVTFYHLDTTQVSATTCDPAGTGTFYQTLLTAAGCDSVIATTVTLLPSHITNLSGQDCNPANVGVFTQDLTNIYGCDSTVITNITFYHLDTTALTASSCDPAQTGVFFTTLVTAAGCDSVLMTTVNLLPSNTTQLSAADCDPANVGVFTQHLTNIYGCDSTVITTVSLLPSNQTALQGTSCDPAQVGVFVSNLTNQFGCDSTVTLTVTLLPSDTTYLDYTTCDPAQVGTVQEILVNQWGCDSVLYHVTTLSPPAQCGVTGTLTGSTIPCGQNTGTLSLTATLGEAPFSYIVQQGGNTVSTGTFNPIGAAQTIPNLAAGAYTVILNSANGFGVTLNSQIIQLYPPVAQAQVFSDYNGFAISCTGETDGVARVQASAGNPPYVYAWSTGGATQQISNLGAGIYSVTVTDINGCTATASTTLTEPTELTVGFLVTDLTCFGFNNGVITVEPSGGVPPYRYSKNNGALQSSNVFSGLGAGTYNITTVDANDCERSEILIINAAKQITVDLGDNQTIQIGDSTILQAIVNFPIDSILSVVWTPPTDSSDCVECLTQVVAPFVSTTYSVRVQAINGCTDEDKVTIFVDRRRYVYFPNVFSPNGDGQNDLFTISAKPGTVKQIRTIQLYDRWGEKLYENRNFQPNIGTIGWDGRLNGQPMSPGVFVWYCEVEFIDGVIELYKGDVTILR